MPQVRGYSGFGSSPMTGFKKAPVRDRPSTADLTPQELRIRPAARAIPAGGFSFPGWSPWLPGVFSGPRLPRRRSSPVMSDRGQCDAKAGKTGEDAHGIAAVASPSPAR